ncbi:MAG: hypothetical protein A49_20650 [Methyloceanibacter sp.]|nr:MAG: hypothetical protein A49_20650 [Methyloceanibacter sp.]
MAPGAKVVPEMPGLFCRLSVIVAPGFARISRSVATVTGTKLSAPLTIEMPPGMSMSRTWSAWTGAGGTGAAGARERLDV